MKSNQPTNQPSRIALILNKTDMPLKETKLVYYGIRKITLKKLTQKIA